MVSVGTQQVSTNLFSNRASLDPPQRAPEFRPFFWPLLLAPHVLCLGFLVLFDPQRQRPP